MMSFFQVGAGRGKIVNGKIGLFAIELFMTHPESASYRQKKQSRKLPADG